MALYIIIEFIAKLAMFVLMLAFVSLTFDSFRLMRYFLRHELLFGWTALLATLGGVMMFGQLISEYNNASPPMALLITLLVACDLIVLMLSVSCCVRFYRRQIREENISLIPPLPFCG